MPARREIGRSGIATSAVGLGTWAIGGWMWGGADDAGSIRAIRASLDLGVTLVDTAPAYGLGRAETIVGAAIAGRRDEVALCGARDPGQAAENARASSIRLAPDELSLVDGAIAAHLGPVAEAR